MWLTFVWGTLFREKLRMQRVHHTAILLFITRPVVNLYILLIAKSGDESAKLLADL